MNTAPQPLRLPGGHIVLRDFTQADVDAAASIIGDDRVTHWLSFDSRDRDGAIRMIDNAITAAQQNPRTEYYLAITEPATDHTIGFARLALSGVRAAKLGYAIHADHWGHGYAADAVSTLSNYAFGALGLHRITAAVGPDNTRSIALLKRLGFTLEGRLRDHVYTNGAWRDSLLYSHLESDASKVAGE